MNDLLQEQEADFDLNAPLDDDLGDIDVNPELVPMQVELQNEEANPEHVIDASSDSFDDDLGMPDLNDHVHVEVFIPVDEDGNQLMINPHEIPEDQLMDADQLMAENLQQMAVEIDVEPVMNLAQIPEIPVIEPVHNLEQNVDAVLPEPIQNAELNEDVHALEDDDNQVMQVSFAEIFEPPIDPVLSTMAGQITLHQL